MSLLTLLSNEQLSSDGLDVYNPFNNSFIASVKSYNVLELKKIIIDAESAGTEWADKTAKQRSEILMRWFHLIIEHKCELANLMTSECGKPLIESEGEVIYGASFIQWFAEEAKRVYGDTIPSPFPDKKILVLKQPIGVSCAITPWNFPLAMITRKAGPALAAGCPIIVKPAEATPLTALALETLAHKAGIPEQVFRILPSKLPKDIGKEMCENTKVKKLSFTGSTAVGRKLMEQCSSNIKKLSLELGGNAPFIVFDDADIDKAVDGALASKFRNAGQTCVCVNRFLVQESVHDLFVQKLKEKVSLFQCGSGMEATTNIGPLIDTSALTKVDTLVKESIADGATIVLGGIPQGNIFPPTILANVRHDMNISHAEIFGPVATITKFETEQEALSMANDTIYGLASYFYSNNLGRVWRVMEKLEYGMVGVNEGIISTEVAPFGGMKQSGLGREGSKYGIDEYLELKYCLLGNIK